MSKYFKATLFFSKIPFVSMKFKMLDFENVKYKMVF